MAEDPLAECLAQTVFLGSVHGDPQGFRKTRAFLESCEPDVVLVEFSPFARVFRKRRLNSFRQRLWANIREAARRCGLETREAVRRPQIRAIMRQICYPFEYRASAAYSNRSQCRLLLVDYSPFSLKCLLGWPELVSAENLTQLLSMPDDRRPSIADIYETAARSIYNNTVGSAGLMELYRTTDPLWEFRERFMAKQIRQALYILKPLRPLFIGGWWHLTNAGRIPTLRKILRLEPHQCRLLRD